MGGLTMFGKTYDTVGSSDSNLILKTRGDIKIQWGGKYIDLIKDGKINSSCNIKLDIVDSVEEIYKDGFYIIQTEEADEVWTCIKGIKIKLTEGANTYVSFLTEQTVSTEQKYQALTNIGFYYKTLTLAQSAKIDAGIIYVEETNKLYIATASGLQEYTVGASSTSSDSNIQDILKVGRITINGLESSISTASSLLTLLVQGELYLTLEDNQVHFSVNIVMNESSEIQSSEFIKGEDGKGYGLYEYDEKGVIETDTLIVRDELIYKDIKDITYDELRQLMSKEQLVINKKYRIIDFQNEWELLPKSKLVYREITSMDTIVMPENKIENGEYIHEKNVRPLIVIAKSTHELNLQCKFDGNEDWTLEYDPMYSKIVYRYTPENTDDFSTQFTKDDNPILYTRGRISKLTDEYGNSCNFDFKHLKFYEDPETGEINEDKGYYLYSRNITDDEAKERLIPVLENKRLPNRELIRDASLLGRYKNNTINLFRPKLYSVLMHSFVLDNDEEDYYQHDFNDNFLVTSYEENRNTNVIFMLGDEINQDERLLYVNTLPEAGKDIDPNLIKSDKNINGTHILYTFEKEGKPFTVLLEYDKHEEFNKLELCSIIYNNNINNISGKFLFNYYFYNNKVLGTLYEKTKYKFKFDGKDVEIDYTTDPSFIKGRITNCTFTSDIISFQLQEKERINNCSFGLTRGIKIESTKNLEEKEEDKIVIDSLTVLGEFAELKLVNYIKNCTISGFFSGEAWFANYKDNLSFDQSCEYFQQYTSINDEVYIYKAKENILGELYNLIINGYLCGLSLPDKGIIRDSQFNSIRGLEITLDNKPTEYKESIIEVTFKNPISDIKLKGVIKNSVFNDYVYGYYKNEDKTFSDLQDFKSEFYGIIEQSTFNGSIKGFKSNPFNRILNSEFDVIEGLKLTCEESKDLIVYSIFKSPITTDFEIKDTINECTFYDSIYGRAKITNPKTNTEEEWKSFVYGKINESTFSGYLKGFQLYQGSFINKSNFISLEAIKIGNDAGVVVNLEYVITKQLFQWVSFLKDCINVNFFDYGRNTDWYCELERNNFYGPFLEVDTKSALEIKYSNFEGIGSNSKPVKIFKNILHSSFLEDICGCSLQNIYSSTFYKGIKGTSNDIIIAEIDSSNIYEELNRGTIIFKLEDSTLYGPITQTKLINVSKCDILKGFSTQAELYDIFSSTIHSMGSGSKIFHADRCKFNAPIESNSRIGGNQDELCPTVNVGENEILCTINSDPTKVTDCSFVRVNVNSYINDVHNCQFNGNLFEVNIQNWNDCTAKGISKVTIPQDYGLKDANFHDDFDGTIFSNTPDFEKERLKTSNAVKDTYVFNDKTYGRILHTVLMTQDTFLPGMIIMWDGHEVVPSGWAVCDGKEYDGLKTPDLRGKFIKASDSEVGDLDSSHLENADKNEIKLKVDQLPQHSHPHLPHTHNYQKTEISVGSTSVNTSSDGGASDWDSDSFSDSDTYSYNSEGSSTGSVSVSGSVYVSVSIPDHSHSVNVPTISSSSEIVDTGETTSKEDSAAAASTMQNNTIKIEPKAYALIFIIKLKK